MKKFEINDSYYCSECGGYFFAPHYCIGKNSNTNPYKSEPFKLVESEDILTKALRDYLQTYIQQADKKTLERLLEKLKEN